MKRLCVLVVILVLAGCGSTAPSPCGDPIRVPAPYWDPPKQLPTLPPTPTLAVESFQCPPDVTDERCAELELEAIDADYLALLAYGEACRNQYEKVIEFIESVPTVVPPPPVSTPTPDG